MKLIFNIHRVQVIELFSKEFLFEHNPFQKIIFWYLKGSLQLESRKNWNAI